MEVAGRRSAFLSFEMRVVRIPGQAGRGRRGEGEWESIKVSGSHGCCLGSTGKRELSMWRWVRHFCIRTPGRQRAGSVGEKLQKYHRNPHSTTRSLQARRNTGHPRLRPQGAGGSRAFSPRRKDSGPKSCTCLRLGGPKLFPIPRSDSWPPLIFPLGERLSRLSGHGRINS